jgi:hypothetical protein
LWWWWWWLLGYDSIFWDKTIARDGGERAAFLVPPYHDSLRESVNGRYFVPIEFPNSSEE